MGISKQSRVSSRRHYLHMVLYIGIDYLAVVMAQELALFIHSLLQYILPTTFSMPMEYQLIFIPTIYIACIALAGGYDFNRPSLDISKDVFWGLCYSFVLCIMMLFFIHVAGQISRLYAGCFFLSSLVCTAVLRYAVGKYLQGVTLLKERIIILGAGRTAEGIRRYFDKDIAYRYQVIGIIDDNPLSKKLVAEYELLGGFDQAEKIIKEYGVQTVLVATPGMEHSKFNALLTRIQPYLRNILFAPDLVDTPVGSLQVQTLFSERIVLLKSCNNMLRRRNRLIKRLFDLSLTIISLPIVIPVLLLLAIIIKLDSNGPVFYNAERLGEGGKNFLCYKFRSMHVDGDDRLARYLAENIEAAAEWKEFAKLRGYDPRVTKAGNWMRKTSLDELPQLINVLIGNMSLVGPRPYLPREKEDMGTAVDTITMIKPGITGFWQVNGRNDINFAGRVAMDEWYVKNWSVWRDILFLIKTFKIVLSKDGAY